MKETLELLFNKFETEGEVISNSPKIRRQLYHYLNTSNIQYTTQNLGYIESTGRKTLNKICNSHRDIPWSRVAKWIHHHRILKEDVIRQIHKSFYDDVYLIGNAVGIKPQDITKIYHTIDIIFADSTPLFDKCDLLIGLFKSKDIYRTVFENVPLRTTIVKIIKVQNL